MNIRRLAGILILLFAFMMGCSGNYGKIKPQSEGDSKVTQRELIDNGSDYNTWLSYYSWEPGWETSLAVIVFDPKNDDRKILVEEKWGTVKDQEMWTEIVKANTTSDGDFRLVYLNYDYTTRVQEIWGPDNQLYGFIIYQQIVVQGVNVKRVNENTMRLSWERPTAQGSPAR